MSRNKIITLTGGVLLIAIVGFFCYDWYAISKMRENPDIELMYSWIDENGEKRFTNTYPPLGAKNIVETEGVAYVRPPLAIIVKNKVTGLFNKAMYLWNRHFDG